ncbi:GumC family protein [candidate division CSSED10-310 bacterium]|uniref:non-specific protein-tyrosine kinase n=1 Tax=candidate division CSSED10-310 bacterium TaxID=2855610 RepID=A0ABV6YSN7_UNCC1
MITNTMSEEQDFQFEIREYLRVILKRKLLILAVIMLVMIITLIRSFTQQNLYTSKAEIQIESNHLQIVNDITQGTNRNFYNTQYRLLLSKAILKDVLKKMGSRHQLTLGNLYQYCRISPVSETQLVNIIYTAPNAQLASQLANIHAQVFIDSHLRKRYEATTIASRFIAEQVQAVQHDIQEDEKKLLEYLRSQEIIRVPKQESMTLAKLQRFDSSLTEAEADRIKKETHYQRLLDNLPETLPEVQANPSVQKLKTEYAELEKKYQSLSQRFQPDWPELKRLKTELDNTKLLQEKEIKKVASAVIKSAQLAYENALERELELRKLLSDQKQKTQNFEVVINQYNALKMRIDNKKKLVSDLMIKESEAEVSARMKEERTSNIWIVEKAEPSFTPSFPNHRKNLSMGLLIGVILGLGVAFLLEYLDSTVKSAEVVERYLKLPFLGFIPSFPDEDGISDPARLLSGKMTPNKKDGEPQEISLDLITLHHPKLPISEAYKNIRTSILLSSDNFSPRKILVTSSQPKEGKTTTAINLAVTLTQLDKKVVIIDADMRNPRIHKAFSLINSYGLSNFLTNNLDPKLLIKKCKVNNLGIITSGPRPSNPSELLSSAKMLQLIEKLSVTFDHVIIDSPPLLAVADALIIGKQVESTILIINADITSRETVAKARDRLFSVNVKIQGVVLNNVDTSKNSYYYYYYYPYKYAYGTKKNRKKIMQDL